MAVKSGADFFLIFHQKRRAWFETIFKLLGDKVHFKVVTGGVLDGEFEAGGDQHAYPRIKVKRLILCCNSPVTRDHIEHFLRGIERRRRCLLIGHHCRMGKTVDIVQHRACMG